MVMILVSARSAIRVMFFLAPFVFLSASFFVLKSYEYAKKSKDDLLKYSFYILSFLSLIFILFSVFGNPITKTAGTFQVTSYSAANTGPVADGNWQNAMSWVR